MNEELNPTTLAELPMHELETGFEVPKEYGPSKQDALREWEISIKFLSRGCVVRVGCKEIAFEDLSKAMAEINEYVTGDTYEVQKKWRKLLD